jgi:alpha-L-fucosidase 2
MTALRIAPPVTKRRLSWIWGLAALALALAPSLAAHRMDRYNVVWLSLSTNASGQMPLGNGDIAAGVYAIADDALYLLLAKNDAYTYNGDIFKTGRVRVSLTPNPFAKGKPFRQMLDLAAGSIRIEADGVRLLIWADAHRPVYHVQIDSPREIAVAAASDLWKRFDDCRFNCSRAPVPDVTQDVRVERDGRILWYFAVGDRSVFRDEMKYYDVEHMIGKFPDPYRFNTFGNLLESPDLKLTGGELVGKGRRFDIRVHALTLQAPKVRTWIEAIERQAARSIDAEKDWAAHRRWWSAFWDRSWIVASDNALPLEEREKLRGEAPSGKRTEADGAALASQSYNVFRFLMACQSRGRVQTKFNGGLFTQPLAGNPRRRVVVKQPDGTVLSHEDDRDWGRRFTYQNQRLLYWPLLKSGDFDLMKPFFDYYWKLLPIRKAITRAWFGHEGAYYRENIEPTGGERDCGRTGKPPKTRPGENNGKGYYHSYYFTSGLETVAMMVEYVKHSGDEGFRDTVLVPFAREVLLFFDKHYPRDEKGKVRLDPAMVLETWWIAVNPAPDVAGLRFCLDELLAMEAGTDRDRADWRRFRAEVSDIHLHEIDGRKAIAPAEKWQLKRNSENGELYPVFPFRCFGLALGSADIVAWTMKHRTHKNAFGYKCWTQDQIHWAYAGNAAEAQDGLVHRFRHASTQCRFPLYGSAGPDSCPDFDHFGSGSTALQRMLVQEAKGKILLLPAWPAGWDVDFKLHVTGGAVLTGTVTDGRLTTWAIEPAARRKDVVVRKPQRVPPRPTVPDNEHSLRIGADQTGANRFRGTIGRVTMFQGRLGPETISALAKGRRSSKLTDKPAVRCVLNPKPGQVLPIKAGDLKAAVSFEAWILPADAEKGRVLDKVTPGRDDGLLVDCWPGLSLRLIVDDRTTVFRGVLKPGLWQHVAVVLDRKAQYVYLNGQRQRTE